MSESRIFSDGTSEIIRAALDIHSVLGPGLLEATYEKCLAFKLQKTGIPVRRQVCVPIRYEELVIDDAYRIDLLVQEQIVVEIKAIESLSAVHFAQLLAYLKATDLRVGLLMNFHSARLKDGIHRVVNNF